jgi:hypothetical protein
MSLRTSPKRPLPFLAAATAVCVMSSASAAITVTGSTTVQGPRLANSTSWNPTTSDWSLSGGNAIAVFFTAENARSFSVTYGGEAMTVVGIENAGTSPHFTGIAYLINPTVSLGDVVISAPFNGSGRLSAVYSIVSLANVGSVADSGTRLGNGAISYTTGTAGSYVLASAGNNNFSGPAPTISGNPTVNLFSGANDGNHAAIHAHGVVAAGGSHSSTYGNTLVGAVIAFDAVPEPAAALLGSLGMLMLLRRRR